MEFGLAKTVDEHHDGNTKNDTSASSVQVETVSSCDRKHNSSTDTDKVQGDTYKHGNFGRSEEPADDKEYGDVNMEACISADDVMRAGGFGARDDISSFLPVASDSTDFEASLRDARDYEEPQKDIVRPGLGWKDVKDQQG